MHGKTRRSLAIAVTVCALLAATQGTAFAQAIVDTKLSPAAGSVDLGIIFNTSDILLSLENYQAGVGIKLGTGNMVYRALIDVSLNGSSVAGTPLSLSLLGGLALEYHFLPAPISPYIGAAVSAGYLKLGDTATSIPMSAGAILGVEIFFFNFLSAFVEYTLAFDMNIVTDSATATTTVSYLLDSRLGNNSKIGLILYFMRMKQRK